MIHCEILTGLTRDDLAAELAALKVALKESEAHLVAEKAGSWSRVSEVINLRQDSDRLRILNEHLEKENKALRHEVERLHKSTRELPLELLPREQS